MTEEKEAKGRVGRRLLGIPFRNLMIKEGR